MLYDALDEMAKDLNTGVVTVAPQDVGAALRLLEAISHQADGLDEWSEMMDADAGLQLHHAFIGQLLMNLLWRDSPNADIGVFSHETKHLAIDLADHMGPDHCQALYHFAVLLTKLA